MQLVRKQNSLAIFVVLYLQVFTSPFHEYYQHCTDCQTIQHRDGGPRARKHEPASTHKSNSNNGTIVVMDTFGSQQTGSTSTRRPLRPGANQQQQQHHHHHNRTTNTPARAVVTAHTSRARGSTTTPSTIVISDGDNGDSAAAGAASRPNNITYCDRLARKDAEPGTRSERGAADDIPMYCVDYVNCPSIERERSSSRIRQLTCGLKFDGTIRVCCKDVDRDALSEEELTGGRVISADETFNSGDASSDGDGHEEEPEPSTTTSFRAPRLSGRVQNTSNESSTNEATVIVGETQTLTTTKRPSPEEVGEIILTGLGLGGSNNNPTSPRPAGSQANGASRRVLSSPMQSKFPRDCGLAEDGYNNRDELRIIGGKSARRNAWPWFALLMIQRRRKSEPECGATLITDRHVLTAAHCVLLQGKRVIPKQQLTVRLGEFNLREPNDGEQDFSVEKVIPHPDFNPRTFKNDIALLKLCKNVSSFSESIKPACLAGIDEPRLSSLMPDAVDNRTAWVLGFGQTSYNGRTSDQLRQADLKIVPHAKCKRAFAHLVKLTRDYVCASSQYDGDGASSGGGASGDGDAKPASKLRDSCQGDSGGPLMMMATEDLKSAGDDAKVDDSRQLERWYIYGIVSFGFKCAVPNFAGVYCRVNRYLDWIAANTDF